MALDKTNFACRIFNVYALNNYDQSQANKADDLNNLIWNIGYYDNKSYVGNVKLTIKSLLFEREYLSVTFAINSNGKTYNTISFSDLLKGDVRKYIFYNEKSGEYDYFFDKEFAENTSTLYNFWYKFKKLQEEIDQIDYDVLQFTFNVNNIEYTNIIEYKKITYYNSYISGGFSCEISPIISNSIEYSFIFGNDKEFGLSTAEKQYLQTEFKSYEYFLIEIDDFGNHNLVFSDTVYNIGEDINNKIVKTLRYDIDNNLYIDSMYLIVKVNFNKQNNYLKPTVVTTIRRQEFTYFKPSIDAKREIGNFIIGTNNTFTQSQQQYFSSYCYDNLNDIFKINQYYEQIKDLYYGIQFIQVGVDEMYAYVANNRQWQYFIQYGIVNVMKNSISYWDIMLQNKLEFMEIANDTIIWSYKRVNDIKEVAIQMNENGEWKTIQRRFLNNYSNNNRSMFRYVLPFTTKNDVVYTFRLMTIENNGIWTYSKPIEYVKGKVSQWRMDPSYLNVDDPFKWESLRQIYNIDWKQWNDIINENFSNNTNYQNYKDLIKLYQYNYFVKYVTVNETLSFNNVINGMNLKSLKENNEWLKAVKPFGEDVADDDVMFAYTKFSAKKFPSIYLRTSFLYCDAYIYNQQDKVAQLLNVGQKDSIKAFIYRYTFYESLINNNLTKLTKDEYSVMNSSTKLTDYFVELPIHFYDDVSKNPNNQQLNFFKFSSELDEFLGLAKYNDLIENEQFFIMFFIKTDELLNYHIDFNFVTTKNTTLNKQWWDEKLAGDESNINKYNNFSTKPFGNEIIYWDAISNDLIAKYQPITIGNDISYPPIQQVDMNNFYDFAYLTSLILMTNE